MKTKISKSKSKKEMGKINVIDINNFQIKTLLDYSFGHDETYFKILNYQEISIVQYPSIKNGQELTFDDKDYLKYKTKIFKKGYRLTTVGNAVACENKLIEMGFNAFAVSPHRVEIVIYQGDGAS